MKHLNLWIVIYIKIRREGYDGYKELGWKNRDLRRPKKKKKKKKKEEEEW